MTIALVVGALLIISTLSCKFSNKAGLPILVGFILIGIFLKRWFVFEDVEHAVSLCNLALLFIIFTGGFQTDFQQVRSVLSVSVVLSSLGTILTAGLAATFGYYVLQLTFSGAMLLGAVISATDAASLFSVLSSKKLTLKNNLGSILQMESGSNDPTAYMLTIIFLSMATGSSQNMWFLLFTQLVFGALVGVAGAFLGRLMLNRLNLEIDGLYAALLVGIALFIYGVADAVNGNGFLAVYIGGIILGNGDLVYKRLLERLFSSLSMLMQIMLFIVLGILCVPAAVMQVAVSGLVFAAFLFFFARPLVLTVLMKPFGRSWREIAFASWAGFRGASSIVFATYLLSSELPYADYVFSVVFFVCLLSVILQGSLIAPLAQKLDLQDEEGEALKPFIEYAREVHNELLEVEVPFGSPACEKSLFSLGLPEELHVVMVKREDKYILPDLNTVLRQGDVIALAADEREKLLRIQKFLNG